jgi:hypothetical protein
MKSNSTSRTALFAPRVLISFALCSVGLLLALTALSQSVNGAPAVKTPTQTPGTWAAIGSMSVARQYFTATLLTNGKVLVAGGQNSTGATSSAELYDPSSETWAATGSLATARSFHTATLLNGGKVLVAGGQNSTGATSSAELYDPATGLWTSTGGMNGPRVAHYATLITTGAQFGKVLVAGGSSICAGCTPVLDSAELFDPSTGLWADTGSMTIARTSDDSQPAILPDGSIIVVGGDTCCPYHWFNNAETYDPVSQTWTPSSAKMTYANEDMILLPDGNVIVAGGIKGTQPSAVNVADAELFDSSTGTWTATASMSTDRASHTLTLLASGQALVAGGYSGGWGVCNEDLTSAELYDSIAGTWSPTGNMTVGRINFTATLLPNGQVLAAGGRDCAGNVRSSAELYTPGTTNKSCLPPPAGLVSWWSGDRTADDVQGTNPGQLVGGASFTRGMVGPGFRLDGIDDRVRIPNSPSLSQTRITLDAWVYATGRQGFPRHIIDKDDVILNKREYILTLNPDNKFHAFVRLPSGDKDLSGVTTGSLNTWYHVAMTHDGVTLKLYVNGQLDGSLDAIGDTVPTSNPVGIGGKRLDDANHLDEVFQGIIDEAQIFNRTLSDAEILAIYEPGAAGQCKPEIFVSSIDPSYTVSGDDFRISTSIVIQDVNGIGISDATVQLGVILPSGSALTFPLKTDATGQADVSFKVTDNGLYQFKVRNVSHGTREYDPALNIETSDTLVIP